MIGGWEVLLERPVVDLPLLQSVQDTEGSCLPMSIR